MKAAEIRAALVDRHRGDLVFEQLRGGAGYGGQSNRYIDLWTMDEAPSRRNRRTAYEIKVSRSDFLREIRAPAKRKAALLFSNQYFFATPVGVIKPEELPPEAGLIEVSPPGVDHLGGTWQNYAIVVDAPWRDTPPPSWRFVVSLIRNARKRGSG